MIRSYFSPVKSLWRNPHPEGIMHAQRYWRGPRPPRLPPFLDKICLTECKPRDAECVNRQKLVGWPPESRISSASATGLIRVLPEKCNLWLCFLCGDPCMFWCAWSTISTRHFLPLMVWMCFFLPHVSYPFFQHVPFAIPSFYSPLFSFTQLPFLPGPEKSPPSFRRTHHFVHSDPLMSNALLTIHLPRKTISLLKYSPLLSHTFDFSYSLKLWGSGALMVSWRLCVPVPIQCSLKSMQVAWLATVMEV